MLLQMTFGPNKAMLHATQTAKESMKIWWAHYLALCIHGVASKSCELKPPDIMLSGYVKPFACADKFEIIEALKYNIWQVLTVLIAVESGRKLDLSAWIQSSHGGHLSEIIYRT